MVDTTVYIGNLGNDATREEIEKAFGLFGPMKKVWVARRPPGFAFVEFEHSQDAADAVRAVDCRTLCGRIVRAEFSHGRSRWPGGIPPPRFLRRTAPRWTSGRTDNHRVKCDKMGHSARDSQIEYGFWVSDQFGKKLIAMDHRFKMEMPEPDPLYNPATHRHLDTFRQFFDRRFFDKFAETTNVYYGQQMTKVLLESQPDSCRTNKAVENPHSQCKDEAKRTLVTGEKVTGRELEIFFGIVLQMSVAEQPQLRMFWEGPARLTNIVGAMTFEKFNHIRGHLQIVDMDELFTNQQQQIDPLRKVAPLTAQFQKSCADLPTPVILRIVETAIPQTGFAQWACDATKYYEKRNSQKERVRIFTLRSESGLIQAMRCYSGKQAIEATETEESKLAVLNDLISDLPRQQPFKLLFDEGFCSVHLLRQLRESGICATGILTVVGPGFEKLISKVDSGGAVGFAGITAKDGSVYICRWTRAADMKTFTVGTTEASEIPLPTRCAAYYEFSPRSPRVHRMLRAVPRHDDEQPTCDLSLLYWILGATVRNSWLLENRWRNQIDARNNKAVYEETCGSSWLSFLKYSIELADELMRPHFSLGDGQPSGEPDTALDGNGDPEDLRLLTRSSDRPKGPGGDDISDAASGK